MSLSTFAILVICFNLLASVLGLSMPWIIEFEGHAKFHDFNQPELTAAYIANLTQQKRPEIVIVTALSLIGIYLGYSMLKRRAWARKGWLAVCFILTAIPATWQIIEPDLSLRGLVPLLLRLVILIASCSVLLNAAVIREFNSASPK